MLWSNKMFYVKTCFLNTIAKLPRELFPAVLLRSFSVTTSNCLKQIEEIKRDKKLIVEGKLFPDPNEARLLKSSLNPECCSVCSTDLEIKHTDVLILSQFVRSDGCMLPRRITGLCKLQQKRISKMVAMAQKAGLMTVLNPANSKKDPKKRRDWRKFNMYFDESTIRPPKDYKPKSYVVQ